MKSDKEDSKNQKEEDNSIPLLDLNQSSIKKLINQAKSKGYLTYSELNDTMPPGEMSSEQIEDIMTALSEMGITLIESDEEQEDKQENESSESEGSKELVAAASTVSCVEVVMRCVRSAFAAPPIASRATIKSNPFIDTQILCCTVYMIYRWRSSLL